MNSRSQNAAKVREAVERALRSIFPEGIRLKVIVAGYHALEVIVMTEGVILWKDLEKTEKQDKQLPKGKRIEIEITGWPKRNKKMQTMVPVKIDGLAGFVDQRFFEDA